MGDAHARMRSRSLGLTGWRGSPPLPVCSIGRRGASPRGPRFSAHGPGGCRARAQSGCRQAERARGAAPPPFRGMRYSGLCFTAMFDCSVAPGSDRCGRECARRDVVEGACGNSPDSLHAEQARNRPAVTGDVTSGQRGCDQRSKGCDQRSQGM